MKIQHLKAHNFRSYSDVELEFNDRGLTVISGHNGAGKSTWIYALYWAIYGKKLGIKDFSPWVTENDGTYVSMKFISDEGTMIRVVRCDKYKGEIEGAKAGSQVFLFQNGVYQNDLRDKKDVNAMIVEHFGYTEELFTNSILFGQKMKRIIQTGGADKKKVFNEALETTFIEDARETVATDRDDKGEELSEAENVLNRVSHKRDSVDENIAQYKKLIAIATKKNKAKIAEKEGQLSNLMVSIAAYLNRVDRAKAEKGEHSRTINEQQELRAELQDLVDEKDDIPKKCDSCGRAHDEDSIKATEKRLSKKIKRLKRGLTSPVSLKQTKDKLKKWTRKLEVAKEKFYTLKRQKVVLETEINDLQHQENPYNIKKLKGEQQNLKRDYNKAKRRVDELRREFDVLNWLLQDPLSNTGLKTYIFDTMVQDINEELLKYSSVIGYEVAFYTKKDTVRRDIDIGIEHNGNLVNYEDLSGGQQQLVDVAILLAIHDVVNENKPCNLMILDEVFESLDSDNVELVGEMIDLKSSSIHVHLITHLINFNPTNATRLYFTLRVGTSIIS